MPRQRQAYLSRVLILPLCGIVLVGLSEVHVPALVVQEGVAAVSIVSINSVDPEAHVVALIGRHSRSYEHNTEQEGVRMTALPG